MSFYPNFRQRFIQASAWGSSDEPPAPGASELVVRMSATPQAGGAAFCKPLVLPQLDLNSVGAKADEPPVSESILKRNKLALFEKQCSQVCEGLYVSGEWVAKSRDALRAHGITHVVNCVGAMYPEYFKGDGVQYRTLWLQDSPSEDILCVLYDTFDFIDRARCGATASCAWRERGGQQQQQQAQARQQQVVGGAGASGQQQVASQEARGSSGRDDLAAGSQQPDGGGAPAAGDAGAAEEASTSGASSGCGPAADAAGAGPSSSGADGGGGGGGGGRVLVHCSQGVSRSTTIAIAYLMWKLGHQYEDVYQAVRALRGVTSPNIGFTCQLLQWQKRRSRPPSRVRVYRIAPHTPDSPLYLVPRAIAPPKGTGHPDWRCLDPRGCFLIHLPSKLYVWRGTDCLSTLLEGGLRCARQLVTYEGAAAPEVVHQGEEPDDLVAALNPDTRGAGGATTCGGGCDISVEPSSASLHGGGWGSGGSGGGCGAAGGAGGAAAELPASRAASGAPPAGDGGEGARPEGGERSAGASDFSSPPASLPASASGSRPASARVGYAAAAAAAAASLQRQPPQQQLRLPPRGQAQGAAAAAGGGEPWGGASEADILGEQLSQQQLGGHGMPVCLVDEYTSDFQAFFRALRAAGGSDAAGAGRLTPRSAMLLFSRDDSGAGGPRPESPASVEGRSRKYRRSESERWGAGVNASRLSSAGSGWWGGGGGAQPPPAGEGDAGAAAADVAEPH
ncbi:MAG: hypothetical protein J3K34DRAFT_524485 [Monoraphidium minutum]|nr:MAG: hypothetical protein J3K34DRAFT_524485 [Monoraphidium minutum]